MDERIIMVNMGQLEVSRTRGDVLTALGLGSCVAVCAYDPLVRLGGMIHVVLPASAAECARDGPAKFADVGVPRLLAEMQRQGAALRRLRVALVGGANVLASMDRKGPLDIGKRNIGAVSAALAMAGASLWKSDVGGKASRSVRLRVATGELTVRTVQTGEATVAVLGPGDE